MDGSSEDGRRFVEKVANYQQRWIVSIPREQNWKWAHSGDWRFGKPNKWTGWKFKGALGLFGLPSVGTNAIGVTSFTEFGPGVIKVGGADVFGAITQFGSHLMSGSLPGKIEATGSGISEDGLPDGCSSISSAESDPDILPN